MDSSQIEHLVREYITAYNRFDVAAMLRCLHQEVVFQNISAGSVNLTTRGKAEFQAQAERVLPLFRQREQRVTNLLLTDNRAEATIAYHAVLAVDLPNGLKAGDELNLEGKSIFDFRDGLLVAIQDIS